MQDPLRGSRDPAFLDAASPDSLSLPHATLVYWRVQAALVWLVLSVALAVAWAVFGRHISSCWFGAGLALVAGSTLWDLLAVTRWRFNTTRYVVSTSGVFMSTGKLIRRSLTLATGKVLHVRLVQGPLMRSFGLAELQLASIIDTHSLGPLLMPTAVEHRATILRSHEDNVT